MQVKPITDNCRRNYDNRTHICFGISPFNSYFSEARIHSLCEWGLQNFSSMHLFVPDVPSAYTMEALGYSPEKSAWKAKRQANYLHNKIFRVLKNLGVTGDHAYHMVLDWEKLSVNSRYQYHLREVHELFEIDADFKRVCLESSRWVMERKIENMDLLNDQALALAVKYFLTEIPLFANTPEILGIESSVFCYHQVIPFLENLYQGKMAKKVSPAQGYIQLEPAISGVFPIADQAEISDAKDDAFRL